jgi:hypothetical protein
MSITFTYDKSVPQDGQDGEYGHYDEEGDYRAEPATELFPSAGTVNAADLVPGVINYIPGGTSGVGVGGAKTSLEDGINLVKLPILTALALSRGVNPLLRLAAVGLVAHAAFGKGGVFSKS